MQFTTYGQRIGEATGLFSKSKSTRFRCNSQLRVNTDLHMEYCFQRAKVQDLDAIHNRPIRILLRNMIVFKEQRYKIESNSQRAEARDISIGGCFQRAKVQDLDAIHNIQRANYFLTFSSSCMHWRQLKSNKHYHSSIIMRLRHWITLVNLGQWLRLRCFFPP